MVLKSLISRSPFGWVTTIDFGLALVRQVLKNLRKSRCIYMIFVLFFFQQVQMESRLRFAILQKCLILADVDGKSSEIYLK